MSGYSAIEWTEATWNPVTGCSKVSRGCDHCYAETLALGRLKGKPGYPGLPWTPENAEENVVLRPERLRQPLGNAKPWKEPCLVFVNSMSDLFHPRVPGEFIAQVFNVMAEAEQHTFQVLTKRPKRMASWAKRYRPEPLPNVWLGTSIESREWVSRADALRGAPAAVRFISAEPLLGPLTADVLLEDGTPHWDDGHEGPELDLAGIDWLIVGGESGYGHRPIRIDWARDLRDHARTSGTAFFFKQWGGHRPKSNGRELDGRTWDEMPAAASAPLGDPRGQMEMS
jgi:protein gp37